MTTLASPGFFGKLPSRGDFVSRRLAGDFVERWDAWLAAGLAASRERLGDAWLEVYLTSPIWRFALAPGACGPQGQIGVMMPSVDKVGRYFPLAAAAGLGRERSVLDAASALEDWYADVENLLLETLAETPLELDELDRRLARLLPSDDPPVGAESPSTEASSPPSAALSADADPTRVADCGAGAPRHLGKRDDQSLREALETLGGLALEGLGQCSFWWTQGSERIAPCALVVRGLPAAETFVAMLDGEFGAHGWVSEAPGRSASSPAGPAGRASGPRVLRPPTLRSAAMTHPGKLRERNEDAFALDEALGVWLVADGMGGHQAGEIASRMVASVVARLLAGGGLADRIEQLVRALGVVNGCLQVLAGHDPNVTLAGSTVAALLADGTEAACLWAGDSRVYLLRGGELRPLSRDHSESALGADNHVITRAVGGPDPLEVEVERTDVRPGDRFLLCTDGLYGEIGVDEIAAALSLPDPQQACGELERAVLTGEARDNLTAVVVYADAAAA